MGEIMFMRIRAILFATAPVVLLAGCTHMSGPTHGTNLFPDDRIPDGWIVRHWADVANPPPEGAVWSVEKGTLRGSPQRGAWLLSDKEYGDFRLKFEWKLPERGNSGVALRAPLHGDPAFDGLELQMVDPRYFKPETPPKPSELSASLYRAIAPKQQLYKPNDWNSYDITLRGSHIKVIFNGVLVQDADLSRETMHPKRHDDSDAPALKDRPLRGHIGFQELSRDGGQVQIRNIELFDQSASGGSR
jgi:hypothetical protein